MVEAFYRKFRQGLIDIMKELRVPYDIESLTKVRHECFRRNLEQKQVPQPPAGSLIGDQQPHFVKLHQMSSSTMSSQTCTHVNEVKILNEEAQTIYATMSSLQVSAIPTTTTTTNILTFNDNYAVQSIPVAAGSSVEPNLPVFYITSAEPLEIGPPPPPPTAANAPAVSSTSGTEDEVSASSPP